MHQGFYFEQKSIQKHYKIKLVEYFIRDSLFFVSWKDEITKSLQTVYWHNIALGMNIFVLGHVLSMGMYVNDFIM